MPVIFEFLSSIQSVQLTGLKASSLAQLHEGLVAADASTIYHHTHGFVRRFDFSSGVPCPDFAVWAGEALREEAIAERMASLDRRDFRDLLGLKEAILKILEEAQGDLVRWRRRVPAGLEFYFCRSTSLILPTGRQASNLEEFVQGLAAADTGSIYYHMLEAPFHRPAGSSLRNDFSDWLSAKLGMHEEARRLASLDPYRWNLETLRGKALEALGRGNLLSR